jgi:hypothetical protein
MLRGTYWLSSYQKSKLLMHFTTFRSSRNYDMHFVTSAPRRDKSLFTIWIPSHCTPDIRENWAVWLEVLPYPPYSPHFAPPDYHMFGPLRGYMRTSTMKMKQQPRKPWVHCHKIQKWASTAVVYSNSCTTGRNAGIILRISWNSEETSPVG